MNATPFGTWKEARSHITQLLAANDRAVERAILALYARQTAHEQAAEATEEHNGVGFGGCDGEIFSSFAKQLLAGKRLSAKQLAVARKVDKHGNMRIGKYWRQLTEIAAEKAALPVAA